MAICFFALPGQTGGFYDQTSPNKPVGAVLITDVQHQALLNDQSQGKRIVADENGYPVAIDQSVWLASTGLESNKTHKKLVMKLACETEILGGIDHDALGDLHHYPTSPTDQMNMNGLVLRSTLLGAGGEPYKFWCADESNVWARRNHTQAQIQAVGQAMAAHVIAAQNNYSDKLAEIDAAVDMEALELIAW